MFVFLVQGFPVHVAIDVFLSKYGCLLQKADDGLEPREQVRNILTVLLLPETEWQVGKTKVRVFNYSSEVKTNL